MDSRPTRRPFDCSANHVVLDFTNTVSGRPSYTRDDLATPSDVWDWALFAGLLPSGRARQDEGGAEFRSAIALREHLYQVFGPIAAGGVPQSGALDQVARRAAHAVRSAVWVRGAAGYEPRWDDATLDAISDRLADEAMRLVRSPLITRVGACAGCGWLFLDTSRAHARRWCSMNACGVRDKMRRYHQRQASGASLV